MEHSYGFEQHVAQQSRRDKLRSVPQNYLRVVDNNELISFHNNPILPHHLSLLQPEMINNNNDNGGYNYWKNSNQQTSDWLLNSATNSSLGGEILNQEVTDSLGGELHLPPIYQNTLQGIVTSASIGGGTNHMEMAFTEINQTSACEGSRNELALLPVYRDPPNVLPCHNTGSWSTDRTFYNWDQPLLGCIERKTDEELRTLSLSLSSNPPSKFPTAQFEESEELHEDVVVSKAVKSESLCRLPKITCIGNKSYGKSLQEVMVAAAPVNTFRSTGPLGPFTGYATILKSSKFLKPAQVLLDEFCGSNGQKFVQPCEVFRNEAVVNDKSSCGVTASTFCGSNETNVTGVGSVSTESHQPEYQQKKAKLLYMLEEVCRRYKQYHQQMQMVVSSFETVAGLSSATPYISLALKTVSRHFRCLKNAISDQLKYLRKVLGEDLSSPSAGTSSSKGDVNSARLKFMEQSFQKQKSGTVNMGFLESQHVWRPQRGLPERAVAILRAWLFEHFLHPYPTDTDKHMLATQTGLSRNQVSNWFINARVRVWKPMVEEIHMLETKGMGAETNYRSHGTKDGSSTMENTAVWTSSEQQPLKTHGVVNEIASHHMQSLGMDSSSGDSNRLRRSDDQQWDQDKQPKMDHVIQSNMEGELMGFMPYRASAVEVGGLGSVSLTLGLRHRVESGQRQPHQLQQQEEQLIRHYGGEMIHDFVG